MRRLTPIVMLVLAVLSVTALLVGVVTYATVALTDIERGLPRRTELLAREMAKLDREYLDLERTVALAAATGAPAHLTDAALKADFLHARIGTVRGIAKEMTPVLNQAALATVEDRLEALEDILAPMVAQAALTGSPLDGAARAALDAAHGDLLAGPRPTRQAAHGAAARAAGAISAQGENLARFRTMAQGVLAFGGLSFLLALLLFIRARLTAAELRRSRERYRELFEGNAAVMLLVDPAEGRVVEGNQAAQDFYGWTQEDLRGKPIGEINATPGAALARAVEDARTGRRRRFDFRHRRVDGMIVDVEVLSGPVRIDGRDLLLSIIHDVSARRAAEGALAESQARHRMVIDATTQGFWYVAPASAETIDVNDSLCAMLGYPRDEMLGRPLFDFVEPEDEAFLRERVATAPHTRHRTYEVRLRRADGGTILTRFNATSLYEDGSGALRGSFAFIEDITVHRAIERRLEESETMLRSMTANVPGVIYQWIEGPGDARGFRYVSPRSKEILGIHHKDLEEDWTRFVIHPEDVPRWERSVLEAVAFGSDWTFEGRMIRPDGRLLWWRGIARPTESADGGALFNGIILDITRQKALEEQLEENRRLLNLALEAGRIGVWDLDLETDKVWFSEGWKRQLGYLPDEFENTMDAWRGVIDPEDAEAALQAVKDYVSGQIPQFDLVQRFRHKNGSIVHIRTRAKAVFNAEGRAVRLIGAHVDLTKEILTQEMLERQTLHNQLILDSTAEGLYGVDPNGRVTFVNRACRRLLGFDEQQLIGADAHATTHHSRADGAPYPLGDCPVVQSMQDRCRHELVEEVLWRADGSPLPVELSAAPMIHEGELVGAIVSFRDVSDRLLWRKELQRSNEELEQFAYAASHDLQEPLRGVTSYLSLLKRRHGPAMDAGALHYVEEALGGALRMTGMIRDLLTYSRVSTRGETLRPVDADASARAALDNLSIAIAEASAEVTVDGPLPWVMADAAQLTSLFQNLIGNAVKYRAADRRPVIRLGAEAHAADTARWTFFIADNGIGMDPAYTERIFQPFQRLHTHDTYGGTGIGLAVCRKVVERHGGGLTVETAPDEGSTFRFDLAAAEPPPAADTAPQGQPDPEPAGV